MAHAIVYINGRPASAVWNHPGQLGAARLSAADIKGILLQAGWTDRTVTAKGQQIGLLSLMTAIALAESSGNPAAVNPGVGAGGRPTNEYSVGLWQINTLVHKTYSVDQLKDPVTNARQALSIYNSPEGLNAWGAYQDNRYKQYLTEAGALPATSADPDSSGSLLIGTGATVLVGLLALVLLLD
jgi:hypothetical protein